MNSKAPKNFLTTRSLKSKPIYIFNSFYRDLNEENEEFKDPEEEKRIITDKEFYKAM